METESQTSFTGSQMSFQDKVGRANPTDLLRAALHSCTVARSSLRLVKRMEAKLAGIVSPLEFSLREQSFYRPVAESCGNGRSASFVLNAEFLDNLVVALEPHNGRF